MVKELVVEADGGSRGNPGIAGYGALIRDGQGAVLKEEAGYIGRATNNVAEYRGLIAGLALARTVSGLRRVKICMDSKLVIEQMTGRWKVKHEAMKALVAEAQEALADLKKNGVHVEYQWVPREANKEADRLSNVAMDAGCAGEPPTWKITGKAVEPYG